MHQTTNRLPLWQFVAAVVPRVNLATNQIVPAGFVAVSMSRRPMASAQSAPIGSPRVGCGGCGRTALGREREVWVPSRVAAARPLNPTGTTSTWGLRGPGPAEPDVMQSVSG